MDSNHRSSTEKGDEGQQFVESLFLRVFTPFYCYLQPKDLLDKQKKEICDLLVCWGDIAIICQIKNWTFKGNHEQYHQDTIEKATEQMSGAERRLFEFTRDIELEHPLRGRHRFERERFSSVIRLVINLGEGEEFYPAKTTTKRGGFVSVINKDTLEVMLTELDTPSDLLQYLMQREALFQVERSPGEVNLLVSGREADLLCLYLRNAREFPASLFDTSLSMISIAVDGWWEDFQQLPEVRARKDANRNSYMIDELIHDVIVPSPGCEPIVEQLLSLTRIERRAFGDSLHTLIPNFIQTAKPRITHRKEHNFIHCTIVFLLYHSSTSVEVRQALTELALEGTALTKGYAMSKIMVIGMSEVGDFNFTYDYNVTPYSAEQEEAVRQDLQRLDWFTHEQLKPIRFKEYPTS